MKRNLIRLSLFAVIGLGLLAGLFHLSNTRDPVFERERFRIKQLLDQADAIEALAVGNSHSAAIDFRSLGLAGYHLWQDGNDVFESKYQLEALLPELPNVKTVFFSVSYFTFRWDNAALVTRNRTSIRRSYYRAIPSWRFIPGDFGNFVFAKLAPLIRNDHWQAVFAAVAPGRKQAPDSSVNDDLEIDPDGKPRHRARFAFLSMDSLVTHTAEVAIPKLLREQAEIAVNNPEVTQNTAAAVVSLIRYLQERDIRLIFFTPPFFELYTELYDKEIIRAMKARMRALQKQFGVEYYDFSIDSSFISNNRLFRDDDHLNEEGARRFSLKLRESLSAPLQSEHYSG